MNTECQTMCASRIMSILTTAHLTASLAMRVCVSAYVSLSEHRTCVDFKGRRWPMIGTTSQPVSVTGRKQKWIKYDRLSHISQHGGAGRQMYMPDVSMRQEELLWGFPLKTGTIFERIFFLMTPDFGRVARSTPEAEADTLTRNHRTVSGHAKH